MKVTRNISFFKKIKGKIECDESKEEEDQYYQNANQNVNFLNEQQVAVQIEPEENQPGYLEQESPDEDVLLKDQPRHLVVSAADRW